MLPSCKRPQCCAFIHRVGGSVLKDVMRPTRVARKHIAERAVVDDGGPSAVALYDFTRAVEITPLALYLLEAARLALDHRLSPWLAAFKLGAVRNAIAELAGALPHMSGGLAKLSQAFL